jgi:26S proteasome regulatory subunit N9
MASGKKPVDFLEDLQTEHPDIASELADMAALYQRKLWHQLTLKIEAAFSSPGFNRGSIPVQLFQSFVMDFAHKINLLKLAHFAVHASKYQPSPQASMDFLEAVIVKLQEMKGLKVAEPVLFLRMHIAQFKLETGAMQEAKVMVEGGKESLDSLSDVDPSVSAAVHYVSSLYHKGVPDFAEFYRSTLMYLSFVSSDSLPEVRARQRMQRARMHTRGDQREIEGGSN